MNRKSFLNDGIRAISILLILTLTIVIIGCAPTSKQYSSIKNDLESLSPEKGRIFFYRPSAFIGFAMESDILLNGKKVGKSSSGTFFYTDVNAGKYQVTIPKVFYPGESGINFEVNKNEVVYVKTWIGGSSFGGRINAELVLPEQAIAEINELRLIDEHLK